MSRSYDVIVVGDYCLDLIFTGMPKFPELGIEVIGSGFEMVPGGTYNPAICMHRLGLKVGWAGDFGNDDFSRMILERAKIEGMDSSLFIHHARPMRRITVVASYPEDRAFLAYYDADPAIAAGVKALASASARAVYIPGVYYGTPFDAGLVLIRAKRMKLVMDGNMNHDDTIENPAVRKAIRSVDCFMPNAREARQLTGEKDLQTAISQLSSLCSLLVVKDGANGAYACQAGKLTHCPALPLTPLDTTGAGDCFNSGFLKAWINGRPVMECLRWGNIVGGLSTQAAGGTGQVVREADVTQWLARYPGSEAASDR